MQKSKTYPIEILLIESTPQNIALITQILNNSKFQYRLHIVNSITETFDFSRKEGNNKNSNNLYLAVYCVMLFIIFIYNKYLYFFRVTFCQFSELINNKKFLYHFFY